MCDALVKGNSPCFKATKNLHKFTHIETDIEVDIVPFGAINEPDGQIVWPDSGNSMNVLGFAEALSHAKTEVIQDLKIQVIDIPAFVVLKVFAWGDRGDSTNKDVEDINLILSKYEDERIYEELVDELNDEVVRLLDANIYLLGQDIGKILQANTLSKLNKLLDKLVGNYDVDDSGSLGYKLKILQKGIDSRSPDEVI